MDDLLQEFIAETRETLEALSSEIVAWEAAPGDRARLDAIFRFVHTVKGSCGFLDLPRLAKLSHAAEDVLAAARDGQRMPDTALVDAVLAIVDRIGAVVEGIAADVVLDDSDDDALIAALTRVEEPVVPAPAARVAAAPRAAPRSIRLNVDLLDRMMSGMSDMVLARNELARRLRDDVLDPRVEAALDQLSLTVADMRDTVTRTRMQKIDGLFSALPRMVRDTAAELGKAVTLRIEGSDVDLDREMIEMMRDPLVHIIRNAIDHGIEAPARRRSLGKPPTGQICITARQSGNQILIEIEDDGAGIDVARIAAKAIQNDVRSAAEVAGMSPAEKLKLVFEPGLSSRDTVSAVSGRGVGMDVVRANIEHVGGRHVVQYRRHLMPLVPFDPGHVWKTSGKQDVLVFSDNGRCMGLAVDAVVDIVRDRMSVELSSARPGLVGSAVIAGRAADVVDVAADVLRHRVVPSYEALAEGIGADDLVRDIMRAVPAPEKVLERHDRAANA